MTLLAGPLSEWARRTTKRRLRRDDFQRDSIVALQGAFHQLEQVVLGFDEGEDLEIGKARRVAFTAANEVDALKERITDKEARKLCLAAVRKLYDPQDYLGKEAPADKLQDAVVAVGQMNLRLGELLRSVL